MGLKERFHDFVQKNICPTDQSKELTEFLDDVDTGGNKLVPSYGKKFASMYFGVRDGFEICRLMFKWDDNMEKSVVVKRNLSNNTFEADVEGFFAPTDSADL
ncbi:MAG TPA: hypothetical protein VLE44_00120 [Candidatus Saccharimonadales bacterium]|nr:hypothetical protein [Candidatus Saccharimonadales bacterium]